MTTFGEQGVVDLIGLVGYFTTISMIMNVARTPPMAGTTSVPLASYPR